MKKVIQSILFLIFFSSLHYNAMSQAPYSGGISNGFGNAAGNLNLQVLDSLYNGSNGNGIARATTTGISLLLNDSLYNGNNGNGFALKEQTTINLIITDSLYNGATADGFGHALQTAIDLRVLDSIYNGGTGRAESFILVIDIDLSSPCNGEIIYWNGSVNVAWSNVNNWDCGVVPGVNSIVIIPSGKPRYPNISTSRQIKKLILEPGSTLTLVNGGILNITGF